MIHRVRSEVALVSATGVLVTAVVLAFRDAVGEASPGDLSWWPAALPAIGFALAASASGSPWHPARRRRSR